MDFDAQTPPNSGESGYPQSLIFLPSSYILKDVCSLAGSFLSRNQVIGIDDVGVGRVVHVTHIFLAG